MLVLTLKVGDSIVFLDEDTEIKVTRMRCGKVRVAIEAPASRRILRKELLRPICLRPEEEASRG